MADMNQLFRYEDFKDFELSGVVNTGQEIRKGSYSQVVELEFHGLTCAGNKISEKLYEDATQNEKTRIWQKLAQECKTMSTLRHPNIVQFMGVVDADPLPIVVTEFLPVSLNSHLKVTGVMSDKLSYSILEDVTTALCYMHSHRPEPLIHGSLTADNVLLTKHKIAKIAYLGETKILGLKSPLFGSSHSVAKTETDSAMPSSQLPDAKDRNIDIFSFGTLVIHTFAGKYPTPPENSEQDQVEFALEQMPKGHPLMKTVKECMATKTANATAPKLENILDDIRCIKDKFDNNPTVESPPVESPPVKSPVEEKPKAHVTANHQSQGLITASHQPQGATPDAVALVEELRLTAGITQSYDVFRAEAENINVTELKIKTEQLEKKVKILTNELESKRGTLEAKNETIKKLIAEIEREKDARIDVKLMETETMLKNTMIRMNQRRIENFQQLTTALSNNMPHPLNMKCKLTWREGTMLPFGITAPQHVIIGSAMFVGGGQADTNDHKHMVLRYCADSIRWDILPSSPYMHFGLGQYKGKLITVGGSAKDDDATVTAKIMHFDLQSGEWVELLAPMPTARRRACVVSHKSSLAVCGGIEKDGKISHVVEVFSNQQWQTASPLPKPRAAMGVAVKDGVVFLTGGYYPTLQETSHAQRDCYFVSLSSLLTRCQFIKWETLTALPVISTMVISHCGTLMAVGGRTPDPQLTTSEAVYAYSDSLKRWIQVDELSFKCASMMVATMFSNEIYVVGGWQDKKRSGRVMIGAYNLNSTLLPVL